MSSLNFRYASVREKSITYENNDSCKQKLVVVQTLHIEYDFSIFSLLVFFFSLSLAPSFITESLRLHNADQDGNV